MELSSIVFFIQYFLDTYHMIQFFMTYCKLYWLTQPWIRSDVYSSKAYVLYELVDL